MKLIGNILWIIFGGFLTCIGWVLAGLLICLTIVGIPFGVQAMKIGVASLAPFGKDVVEGDNANSPLKLVFNVIWIILFGWELALAHAALGISWCITIVGIPFGIQHFKLAVLALLPFGRDLR